MFTTAPAMRHPARRPGPDARTGFLARIIASHRYRRELRAMRELEDRLLADIGLTRDEAEALDGLPKWDAPAHWQARSIE